MDFSGEWVASGSDKSTHDPSHDAAHSDGHGMGGPGVHGGGMGGRMGGGRGGHRGRSAQDQTIAGSGASAIAPADSRAHAHALIIRQSDVVFDIAADGTRTAYRFDNRNNDGAQYCGTVTTAWSEPELVIETHPDAGGMIENITRCQRTASA